MIDLGSSQSVFGWLLIIHTSDTENCVGVVVAFFMFIKLVVLCAQSYVLFGFEKHCKYLSRHTARYSMMMRAAK